MAESCTSIKWRKSTRSGGGNCVEVALAPGHDEAWIRDSKNPAGPVLQVGLTEWRNFVSALRTGELDGS
ncbi:DUF397 domain-containing protein [Actinoplanes sp. N902-109]|uniref:DUF397 domain-containing protein n=1 Tax=Actinoplanes sp. (strain N902-109) TaxID=649831 RepID=UPI0018DD8AF9|nr:DUF397 domain-containing protein [Actinoplanes sp. N902-109]